MKVLLENHLSAPMARCTCSKPQSGQVLVRIEAGYFGTDLHFLRNNEDWTPLGHE